MHEVPVSHVPSLTAKPVAASRRQWMFTLSLFAVGLALMVVILGAFTRLSDAGLGCPDWPGCYGHLTWPKSAEDVASAEARFPEAPVEHDKTWPEMVHRYFAGTLGFFVLKSHLIEAGIISRVAYQFIAFGLCLLILILTLFYFNLSTLEKWLVRWVKMPSWLYLVQAVRQFDLQGLGQLLLLSGIRYAVFVTQYILLFRLFEVNVSAVIGF